MWPQGSETGRNRPPLPPGIRSRVVQAVSLKSQVVGNPSLEYSENIELLRSLTPTFFGSGGVMLGNPANKYLTCILRMRLRHNKHAHPRMPQLTQLSAVEVVAHHGHDHVFRLIAAVHVSNGMVVVLCVRLVPSTRRETSRVFRLLAAVTE